MGGAGTEVACSETEQGRQGGIKGDQKMDVTDIAKSFAKTGNTLGLDRSHFHAELTKLAAEARRPTESIEQAYSRLSVETESGKALFKAAVHGPEPKPAVQDLVQPSKPEPAGPASRQLNEMATAMARDKGVSFEQAFNRIWSDPDRAVLVQAVKREEFEQRARVRDARWPIAEAEQEFSRDWRLGRTPGSRRI
jgi:hypothetical protein